MKEERKGRGTFRTISLPAPLVDAVEKVIKELQYWPTKTDFIRESVIEKLERYKEELETKKHWREINTSNNGRMLAASIRRGSSHI